MPDPTGGRRRFLGTLAGGTAALAAMSWPEVAAAWRAADAARQAPDSPFRTLSTHDARTLDAVTAQLVPGGPAPGAREARVVRFLDHWYAGGGREQWPLVQQGLAALDAQARERGAADYAALDGAAQVTLLERAEERQPEFFEALRFATILGMFTDPKHGGNEGKAGWALLGFEDRFAWHAPFGSYDRE